MLLSVAAIFAPMCPLFPTPVAIQDEVYHFVETLIQVIYLHEYCLCLILEATLGNVCILTHCFFLCLVVCAPHSSFPHEGKMPGVECAGDVR